MQQITEDEFDDLYPPVTNHLNCEAAWDGCLFDTHGAEYEFVSRQDPRKVWTLVDDDDKSRVLSGFHINRLGYLISQVAVPEGIAFEVVW